MSGQIRRCELPLYITDKPAKIEGFIRVKLMFHPFCDFIKNPKSIHTVNRGRL